MKKKPWVENSRTQIIASYFSRLSRYFVRTTFSFVTKNSEIRKMKFDNSKQFIYFVSRERHFSSKLAKRILRFSRLLVLATFFIYLNLSSRLKFYFSKECLRAQVKTAFYLHWASIFKKGFGSQETQVLSAVMLYCWNFPNL